jgi:hypothetical protein
MLRVLVPGTVHSALLVSLGTQKDESFLNLHTAQPVYDLPEYQFARLAVFKIFQIVLVRHPKDNTFSLLLTLPLILSYAIKRQTTKSELLLTTAKKTLIHHVKRRKPTPSRQSWQNQQLLLCKHGQKTKWYHTLGS